MKTKDIHQTEIFNADPSRVYKCIMNAKAHSEFTGDTAMIKDRVATAFSAFGGYIQGKNILLEKGKKIVQLWRAEEDGWPEDHISEVSFTFNEIPEGTRMDFYHTGIPAKNARALAAGWKEHYWEPMKEYLAKK